MKRSKFNTIRGSIVTRLSATAAFVSILSLVIGFIGVSSIIDRNNESHSREMLRNQANIIAGLVKNSPDINSLTVPNNVKYLLNELDTLNLSYSLVTENGIVASGISAPRVDNQLVYQIAAGASVSGEIVKDSKSYRIEGRPLPGGRGLILFQPEHIDSYYTNDLRTGLALTMIIGFIVSLGIAIVTAKQIANPLVSLEKFSNNLVQGDRGLTGSYQGVSEIENLLKSLNNLSTSLLAEESQQKRFLLSVTHELKTPLTSILAYSKALKDGVMTSEYQEKAFSIIYFEASKLDNYVKDLIDLAKFRNRKISIHCKSYDLGQSINISKQAWEMKMGAFRKEVLFKLHTSNINTLITNDEIRVQQILDILIENAINAEASTIEIELIENDNNVSIQVKDDGPGLTDSDLTVAFEESALHDRYRGKKRIGSGIGLALAKEITTALQGEISVSHNKPSGACFTLTLPKEFTGRASNIDLTNRDTIGI